MTPYDNRRMSNALYDRLVRTVDEALDWILVEEAAS